MLGLLAAAAHDVDHPGVNQPFLIKTNHHLANLYQVRKATRYIMVNWYRPSTGAWITLRNSHHSGSALVMTTAKQHGLEIGSEYPPGKIKLVCKDIQGIQFAPKQVWNCPRWNRIPESAFSWSETICLHGNRLVYNGQLKPVLVELL